MARNIPSIGRSLEADGRAFVAGGVATGGVTIVDDFEDTDETAWSTAPWSYDSTTVYNGSQSITYGDDLTTHSHPGDGLNAYPSKGVEFNVYLQMAGGFFPFIRYGVSDGTDTDPRFQFKWRLGADDMSIQYVDENSNDSIVTDTNAPTYSEGTWYEVNIVWDDSSGTLTGTADNHSVTITEDPAGAATEFATMSGTNTNDPGDGVGIELQNMHGGDDVWVDYWHIVQGNTA